MTDCNCNRGTCNHRSLRDILLAVMQGALFALAFWAVAWAGGLL